MSSKAQRLHRTSRHEVDSVLYEAFEREHDTDITLEECLAELDEERDLELALERSDYRD